MPDSQQSKVKFDILNPHEVMASGLQDWNKIYLIAFIVFNPKTQAERSAACGYLADLIGLRGTVALMAIISYYSRACPDVYFPCPDDLADELKSLLSDIP